MMHIEDLNIHHNLENVQYMNNIDVIDEGNIVLKISNIFTVIIHPTSSTYFYQ
jgi:hypothetical protein